jgi:ABC-type nickel/cobalt efflux system permease component RcnA
MTSSGLGSLLGMRHALEPDHLAAVSTLVTGERNTVRAALLGVCWGLGHTLSLIVVGTVLVILRAEMPVRVADAFELCVALMLIALGLRARGRRARRTSIITATRCTCTRVRPPTFTSARGRWRGGRWSSARFTASPAAARSPRSC